MLELVIWECLFQFPLNFDMVHYHAGVSGIPIRLLPFPFPQRPVPLPPPSPLPPLRPPPRPSGSSAAGSLPASISWSISGPSSRHGIPSPSEVRGGGGCCTAQHRFGSARRHIGTSVDLPCVFSIIGWGSLICSLILTPPRRGLVKKRQDGRAPTRTIERQF